MQCAEPAAGIGRVRAVVLHRRGMVRVRGRAERARLHIHTRVARGDLNLAWVAYCGEPGQAATSPGRRGSVRVRRVAGVMDGITRDTPCSQADRLLTAARLVHPACPLVT